MLKKIATKDLRIGMFVADIGRSWFNHPWKSKSKLLSSYDEIRELSDFGINEVTIDTDKCKVISAPPQEAAETESKPPQAAPPARLVPAAKSASAQPESVSELELALPQAAKIYSQALDTTKALDAACRMNKKIDLGLVKESVDGLIDSISRNQSALMALMKLRHFDDYTYTHSLNVSVLAISAGKSMGLPDEELSRLGLGTMFHDLGKTKIPGYILNKPSKLTDDEFTIMRTHAALSGEIIEGQQLNVHDDVYSIARHHHERMDGSGYPDQLTGDKISFLVTLSGLSDVYDALTSDRVYHKGRPPHEALKIIYGMRGSHFDPDGVDRFVLSVGIYPPGTVVQLDSFQVAVVMSVNPNRLSEPMIKIVADSRGMIYSRPKLIDLASPSESQGLKISKIIPKAEAGFDPAYYFNLPKE